jgi:uncharacterized protein YlzI (FlbEa/FlbD family)
MPFIQLTDTKGTSVFVNTDNIFYFKQHNDNAETIIITTQGTPLVVKEHSSEIDHQIEKAINPKVTIRRTN